MSGVTVLYFDMTAVVFVVIAVALVMTAALFVVLHQFIECLLSFFYNTIWVRNQTWTHQRHVVLLHPVVGM